MLLFHVYIIKLGKLELNIVWFFFTVPSTNYSNHHFSLTIARLGAPLSGFLEEAVYNFLNELC